MTYITDEGVPQPPIGEVGIVYLGPVAPHWEVRPNFGDPQILESFRDRIHARLMLLPPHDPQFRRVLDLIPLHRKGAAPLIDEITVHANLKASICRHHPVAAKPLELDVEDRADDLHHLADFLLRCCFVRHVCLLSADVLSISR